MHKPSQSTATSKVVPYRRHDPSTQPESPYEPYRATILRSPRKPLVFLPHTLSEITGPVYDHNDITESDNDLTQQRRHLVSLLQNFIQKLIALHL